MAKGFKHGSSGGSELNFRVISGTEQPASPRENDIWIVTGSLVSGWVFDASEPLEPIVGLAWVKIDTSSTAPFNAVKKNGIRLCPVAVSIWDGSEWADAEGRIWNGDTWVTVRYPFFWIVNAGGIVDYSGGWERAGNAYGGQNSDGSIYLKTTNNYSGSLTMDTGISDFAKRSKLHVVQSTKVNGHYLKIINSGGSEVASVSTYNDESHIIIDLGSLGLDESETYRFRIQGGTIGGTSGATTTVTKVWLE